MNKKLLSLFFFLSFIFSATILSAGGSNDILFIENAGQIKDTKGNTDEDVLYMIRSKGLNIYIKKNSLHYQFFKEKPAKSIVLKPENVYSDEQTEIVAQRIDMQLEGALKNPDIITEGKSTYTEFFYSKNQSIGAGSFKKITLKNIYDGIDWVLYSVDGKLKYDFVVNAGADYHNIQIKYSGMTEMKLMPDQSLWLNSALGNITEEAPYSYIKENKKAIASEFILNNNTIRFNLKNVSKKHEAFVIDPGLEWGTYYGGEATDDAYTIKVDNEGNIYTAGNTKSYLNISTSGSHQDSWSGNTDMYLVKMDKNGNKLWATYYGDGGNDFCSKIAIDADNNIYLAGGTYSDVNMTSNGFQDDFGGDVDGILVKFNSDGIRLWATYYGGSYYDGIDAVCTDKNGDVFIAGSTLSDNAIATSGSFRDYILNDYGFADAFIAKFDSSGKRIWASYFGGTSEDFISALKSDDKGNLYIAGYTASEDFIFHNGEKDQFLGFYDGFITKFDTDGKIDWSTYYGGSQYDLLYDIELDKSGNIYAAGYSQSTSGIALNGFQNTKSGSALYADAFLSKFSNSGYLIWGTYYGGTEDDFANGIYLDENEHIVIAGYTKSATNVAFNGFQNSIGGASDAFVAKFDKNGNRKWGTYYGGKASTVNNWSLSGDDNAKAIAGNKKGSFYIAGSTLSRNNISYQGLQDTLGGGVDAFIFKMYTDRIYIENMNTSVCPNEQISVQLQQTIDMKYGNSIRVEQSSVNGDFTNPQLLATINDSLKGSKNISLTPVGTFKSGDHFLIRFITSAPADTIYARDTIFINALPANGLQADNEQFCEGGSANLTAPSGTNYTYEWYRNDTLMNETAATLPVTKNGKYKVKVANTKCSIFSNEKTITVFPLPEKPVVNRSGRVLSTGNYNVYKWYKDDKIIANAMSKNYTVSEDGVYKVVVENAFGCENESDGINVSVSGFSPINSKLATVYPVPALQILYIDALENCKMALTDMNGKTLMAKDLFAGNTSIDLSGFAPGVYMVRLQNEAKTSELKIVKE